MKKDLKVYKNAEQGNSVPKLIKIKDEVQLSFDDTAHIRKSDNWENKRVMVIDGREYHITSLFPTNTKTTVTDRMLLYIDGQLENEKYNG